MGRYSMCWHDLDNGMTGAHRWRPENGCPADEPVAFADRTITPPAPPAPVLSDDDLARARALGAAHEEALHALIAAAPPAPISDYRLRMAYAEGATDAKRARLTARHHAPADPGPTA